jgi:molybdenum cofactor cytidylyltransferase
VNDAGGAAAAAPAHRSRGARVAALVLAAGQGSRFSGGPKLLAPFRCRPLLAWAVGPPLEAGLPVVIVRGAVDLTEALADFGAGVTVVENPRWEEGQATSLEAGIAWCDAVGFDAAVVGLGDQPLVPSSAWRAVANAELAPIVSASYRGRRRPPVRLDRRVWPLLSGVGDEGARELMRRRPDLVAEVACEGDPMDVDTVEELRAQERRENAGTPGSYGTR